MRKRILIVDDQQTILNVMQRNLREFKNEYEVFATTNSNEVSKLIEKFAIDLLITDIIMPDKEGVELIQEIRQKHPLVKVITMSGGSIIGGVDFLDITKKLGSSYTLNKPFTKDELISAIRRVLNQRV